MNSKNKEPRVLSVSKCTKFNCPRCDFGYILRYYVKPIMQALTNDIPSYYMQLRVSKCLNQAVLMAFFMLGKRGIKIADYCDTTLVQKRHQDGQDDNAILMERLRRNILHKACHYRQLYYILMTDASFPHEDGKGRHFPGHVFIIEKIPGKPLPIYYFHQAYINAYDYNGHIKRNNGSLSLTWEQVKQMMGQIHYILMNPTWDEHSVKYWKQITFVNTSNMLGAQSGGKMFLCFRKAKLTDCIGRLEKYTHKKLAEIHKLPISHMDKIYGDESAYDADQKPLTVRQMRHSLLNLSRHIEKSKFEDVNNQSTEAEARFY